MTGANATANSGSRWTSSTVTTRAAFSLAATPPECQSTWVLSIITAVASALDDAHRQGLLHRDVKPANIMLTHVDDDGEQRILLTDFGIARSVDDISGLTSTNMSVGTVAYSAPEQLMGDEIDGRADQYALAATAYHLLTGLPLFPHSNPAVAISRHLNAAPPVLADTRPELAALDPVLAAALAKNPDQRFASCSDFARAFADQVSPTSLAIPIARTASAPLPLAGTAVAGEPSSINSAPAPMPVVKLASPERPVGSFSTDDKIIFAIGVFVVLLLASAMFAWTVTM